MELCEEYVQKVTFDSCLYKTVQGNDPAGDLKLGWKTLSSWYKYKNQKTPDPMRTSYLGPIWCKFLEAMPVYSFVAAMSSGLYVFHTTGRTLGQTGVLPRLAEPR